MSVAQILGAMLRAKFSSTLNDVKTNSLWDAFRSVSPPVFDMVYFLDELRAMSPGRPELTDLTMIMAMRLIGSFSFRCPQLPVTAFTIHRLFVACYTVMNKMISDFPVRDKDWTKVFSFKPLELRFLQTSILQWMKGLPIVNSLIQTWVVYPVLQLTHNINYALSRNIPVTVNYIEFFDLHFCCEPEQIMDLYFRYSFQFIKINLVLPDFVTKKNDNPFPAFSSKAEDVTTLLLSKK
jgi:hypothetical protein